MSLEVGVIMSRLSSAGNILLIRNKNLFTLKGHSPIVAPEKLTSFWTHKPRPNACVLKTHLLTNNTAQTLSGSHHSTRCSWANLKKLLPKKVGDLKSIRIAFVGDSRVRDLYSFLWSIMSGEPFDPRPLHHDLKYFSGPPNNVKLDFYWIPFPDESVKHLTRQWCEAAEEEVPHVVVYGTGAHYIWSYGQGGVKNFTAALDLVALHFKELSARTNVVWLPILPIMRSKPTQRKGSNDHRLSPTAERYGRRFAKVALSNGLFLWESAYQVARTHLERYRDNVHMGTQLLSLVICQLTSAIDSGSCRGGF
ncbi:hypothetical protein BV898_14380 [Hypsibius exemplaris]|uniref:Uncharacterized protein n=1 Tax=Hypsibius exemplaris TaxID=2072580 RepID=A0A9X6NAE9_HYPEX|nr:hypothetical protein BV898_14380 [Hypsibius exemplaris]